MWIRARTAAVGRNWGMVARSEGIHTISVNGAHKEKKVARGAIIKPVIARRHHNTKVGSGGYYGAVTINAQK